MKVRCERDGTVFEAEPKQYPTKERSMSEAWCDDLGYAYPCRTITCPTCRRMYFHLAGDYWLADRGLTIIDNA